MAVSSVFSPEPPTPDSPQVSLVHCIFPLLVPRVTNYKRNIVLWPFKKLSTCPALSLADRNSVAFHRWTLSGFLSGSGAVAWEAQLGV